MIVRQPRWKPPARVLPLLLPLELLLLLTVSAVASVRFSPIYQKTLTADQITRNESDVPSVCKCRQLCATNNKCKAYTVDRLSSKVTDCRFSKKLITAADLKDSPFAMTFIRTDDLGQEAPADEATDAPITALPQPSPQPPPPLTTTTTTTTTTRSSITNPADLITTTAEATTTSTENQMTTSTTSTSTSTTTTTTVSTTRATTTSTTTTTTTTPVPVEVFLSSGGSRDGSYGHLNHHCGTNAVPASLTSVAKINQLKTDWGSEFDRFGYWVALTHNNGNPVWPDGTLYSDTGLTNELRGSYGNCYWFNNDWEFIRKSCSSLFERRVVCERSKTPSSSFTLN